MNSIPAHQMPEHLQLVDILSPLSPSERQTLCEIQRLAARHVDDCALISHLSAADIANSRSLTLKGYTYTDLDIGFRLCIRISDKGWSFVNGTHPACEVSSSRQPEAVSQRRHDRRGASIRWWNFQPSGAIFG